MHWNRCLTDYRAAQESYSFVNVPCIFSVKILNGLTDSKNSIEKPPSLNEEQPVKDEASKKAADTTVTPVTREQVLKACVNTSAALAAAGLAIRQVYFLRF